MSSDSSAPSDTVQTARQQTHATVVTVARTESNFDRACEQAYKTALAKIGVNEDGYVNGVECDEIFVKFVSYERCASPVGHSHNYVFAVRWTMMDRLMMEHD